MSGRKRKSPSGSTKHEFSPGASGKATYDLWLPLPKKTETEGLQVKLVVQQLLGRLESTGYTHAALTHTVYGRPQTPNDQPETALPGALWQSGSAKRNIKVSRRLHAVVENLSDVGHYVIKKDDSNALLEAYDIVSIAPRNDATFQAACVSATAAEIITLDYTAGRSGVKLPFYIRATDVKAAVERNVVFEVPYGPAILNQSQRKALVHTCRLLQSASLGLKVKVLLSSGDRTEAQRDTGGMALRTPGDLVNLLNSVLRFESGPSQDALHRTGAFVLERGRNRRFKKSIVSDVYILDTASEDHEPDAKKAKTGTALKLAASDPEEEASVVEDGFIGL